MNSFDAAAAKQNGTNRDESHRLVEGGLTSCVAPSGADLTGWCCSPAGWTSCVNGRPHQGDRGRKLGEHSEEAWCAASKPPAPASSTSDRPAPSWTSPLFARSNDGRNAGQHRLQLVRMQPFRVRVQLQPSDYYQGQDPFPYHRHRILKTTRSSSLWMPVTTAKPLTQGNPDSSPYRCRRGGGIASPG